MGRDLGSAWAPNPSSEVQFLDGLLMWSWPREWRTRGGSSRSAGESPGDHSIRSDQGIWTMVS